MELLSNSSNLSSLWLTNIVTVTRIQNSSLCSRQAIINAVMSSLLATGKQVIIIIIKNIMNCFKKNQGPIESQGRMKTEVPKRLRVVHLLRKHKFKKSYPLPHALFNITKIGKAL